MTLAGLVLENLKCIPLVGEVMVVNSWRLEVMEIDNNRIKRVLASRLSDTARVFDGGIAGEAAAGRNKRRSEG